MNVEIITAVAFRVILYIKYRAKTQNKQNIIKLLYYEITGNTEEKLP